MTEPIKIPFTPITLKHQKPTEVKECFVELHENRLRFRLEMIADESKDENDESLGNNIDVQNYFDIRCKKQNIAGVELRLTIDLKWGIYIHLDGFATDVRIYFKSKTKAEEMFNKIDEWLFK
jgi:hypothetical protein